MTGQQFISGMLSNVATEEYPMPFYVRMCGRSKRAAGIRCACLFGLLFSIGLLFDRILVLSSYFQSATFYLLIYCLVISFGLWVVVHMYWLARECLTTLDIRKKVDVCLQTIYADAPILVLGFIFAIFVALVQSALKFGFPPAITVYLVIWNALAGFICGLGISMAWGSLKLAKQVGYIDFEVSVLRPARTPELKSVSNLLWTYSMLFTLEVLCFSLSVTFASATLTAQAGKIFNSSLTALDIAGATAFFFVAIFSPVYAVAMQHLAFQPAQRAKAKSLTEIDDRIRTALASSHADLGEQVRAWIETSKAIERTNAVPLQLSHFSKFLGMLVPGLMFLYSRNADTIMHVANSTIRLFFPSLGN